MARLLPERHWNVNQACTGGKVKERGERDTEKGKERGIMDAERDREHGIRDTERSIGTRNKGYGREPQTKAQKEVREGELWTLKGIRNME